MGLMALPVAFFAVFFAYPVTAIVTRGLKIDGAWRFGRIGEVLAQSDIRHVLWFTTWQALASTALTLLIALPRVCLRALRLQGSRCCGRW